MARARGSGKTPGSGRKRGTPNKRTLELSEALEACGCSIPDHIQKLLNDDTVSSTLKVDFISKIMQYLYPQRKAIDPDGYISVEQATQMQLTMFKIFQESMIRKIDESLVDEVLHDVRIAATAYSPNGSRQNME